MFSYLKTGRKNQECSKPSLTSSLCQYFLVFVFDSLDQSSIALKQRLRKGGTSVNVAARLTLSIKRLYSC